MKQLKNFKLIFQLSILMIGSFASFIVINSVSSPKVAAITCPDGSTLPDAQADQCPDSVTDPCASAEAGSEEANGCSTFKVEFDEAINKQGKYQCGKGSKTVYTGFNFGCRGESYNGTQLNPIVDLSLAIFRFLSAGVGVIVIASVIVAGIQYTMSRGNPQVTAAAINRVTNAVIALLLYIFMWSIANFLVPGGMFI